VTSGLDSIIIKNPPIIQTLLVVDGEYSDREFTMTKWNPVIEEVSELGIRMSDTVRWFASYGADLVSVSEPRDRREALR
jgi:hypothetical protein